VSDGSGPYGIRRTPEQIAKTQAGRRKWLDAPGTREAMGQRLTERLADPEIKRRYDEGQRRRWERYYAERGTTLEEARRAKAEKQALAKERGPRWMQTEEGREFYRRLGAERWERMSPEKQRAWVEATTAGRERAAPRANHAPAAE
jgi:hypothetical protein